MPPQPRPPPPAPDQQKPLPPLLTSNLVTLAHHPSWLTIQIDIWFFKDEGFAEQVDRFVDDMSFAFEVDTVNGGETDKDGRLLPSLLHLPHILLLLPLPPVPPLPPLLGLPPQLPLLPI